MKRFLSLASIICLCILMSCNRTEQSKVADVQTSDAEKQMGQSGVKDDLSQRNVVQVASGSKDHTTLVTAVKAAELVDVLSNTGPFTVFAPTNSAFDKLPTGTVDGLLKPEKKGDLELVKDYKERCILCYACRDVSNGIVKVSENSENWHFDNTVYN